jgi:hypothetical protein
VTDCEADRGARAERRSKRHRPAQCLDGFDQLELADDVRELFLAGNAARVFGL